jgi:hypothetical protein
MKSYFLIGAVVLATMVVVPGRPVAGQAATCGFSDLSGVQGRNVLFIDANATYWHMAVPVPEGGYVEVAGDFPRARYMSLANYAVLRSAEVDHLTDYQIDPDPGSVNPFRAGSDRNAANRGYTVRVVDGREPADGGEANTLYTVSKDGSRKSGGRANVTLRVYLPDDVTDPTGGVGLPTITSVSADGERTVHPACLDDIVPGSGVTVPGGLGDNPPIWDKFVPNFGGNADNSWIYETFMPSYGQVLTLRGKAPTWGPAAPNDGAQLRYWSLCSYRLNTAVYDCVVDQDIPVDDDGYWTIVVSRAEDRPANATTECGVAWLEAVPDEDTYLAFRHMLPDPSFAQAIQHIEVGSEEAQMGDYYPAGTYGTVADYESLGCDPRKVMAHMISEIEDLVNDGEMKVGQARGLTQPLVNAIRSLDHDRSRPACGQLAGFVAKANHKVANGALTAGTAEHLISHAETAQALLGCCENCRAHRQRCH